MLLNFWPTLTGPGRQSNQPFLWLKLWLETKRSSASLEHLIDLLACLQPELSQKPHCAQKSKKCRKSVSLPLTACVAGDNSPDANAREVFKSSKDSWNLVVCTEKKTFEIWVWGFGWISSGLGYALIIFGFLSWRHHPDNESKLYLGIDMSL